jgi:hypothetical protein
MKDPEKEMMTIKYKKGSENEKVKETKEGTR